MNYRLGTDVAGIEVSCETYELAPDETASEGIFNAVASVEDCDRVDLPPLAETTDPDAVDALLDKGSGRKQFTLTYCGYVLTVTPREVHVWES